MKKLLEKSIAVIMAICMIISAFSASVLTAFAEFDSHQGEAPVSFVYTDFERLDGWYSFTGDIQYPNSKHTQLLIINSETPLYFGYKNTSASAKCVGAFFDADKNFISGLDADDLVQYDYDHASIDPSFTAYADLYMTTAVPSNAVYFSYNLAAGVAAWNYRMFVANVPVYRHTDFGDTVIYDDDPMYQTLKDHKVLVIGASTVMIDRYNPNKNGFTQYICGWQEYVLPYVSEIKTLGNSGACYGSRAETTGDKSIYDSIVRANVDVSGYDTIIFTTSTNGMSATANADPANTNNRTYFGGLKGVISYVLEANPDAQVILNIEPNRGDYYTSDTYKQTIDNIANGTLGLAEMYGYEVIDNRDIGFNADNLSSLTYDGLHCNHDGNKLIGENVLDSLYNIKKEPEKFGSLGYYNVISKDEYDIVPDAVKESEIVLNNDAGDRRQVLHVMEIDPSNPDISIVPAYYGIDKDLTDSANWCGPKLLTDTAKYYEDNLDYEILGGISTASPSNSKAPYSFLVYNGQVLVDTKNGINNQYGTTHAGSLLCVYKDAETGLCSVEVRSYDQGLRGDEWQAISANASIIVKNGNLVTTKENRSTTASDLNTHTTLGVKADGTLILCATDGKVPGHSTGSTYFEEGEAMQALGCVFAARCCVGITADFISKRDGDETYSMRSVNASNTETASLQGVFIARKAPPEKFGALGYYNVISKDEYDIVPEAVKESEIVLNNDAGSRLQKIHVMEIDPSNPDISIVPAYYGIDKDLTNSANWSGPKLLTDTAKYYEDNLDYEILGGISTTSPSNAAAPYTFLVYNGQVIVDAKNGINNQYGTTHAGSLLCVYKDAETGECSVEVRSYDQGLRGDEWQAISGNYSIIVRNGNLVTTAENRSTVQKDCYAHTTIGVKADGTLVLFASDGQISGSTNGMTYFEEGEAMQALGCVFAARGAVGMTADFITKRPGEEENSMRVSISSGVESPSLQGVFIAKVKEKEPEPEIDKTKFGTDGYYNIISSKTYDLVPGAATETEMVLNNNEGNRRQVLHVIEADPSNPDISIVSGYYGIDKDLSNSANWKSAELSRIAEYYEDELGYNIVGGMNTALKTESAAPIDFLVYNGVRLSDGKNTKVETFLAVIKDPVTGEISCELHKISDGIPENCWQAVGANFGFIVNDGQLVSQTVERETASAPRSMIGIKEDGTLVLCMNDGRGANNSLGLCKYEEGEAMLALGCKWAVNGDGGGSSSFITRRVGDDGFSIRCRPCDGTERPTIHGVFITSNVNPTGVLKSAEIESEYECFVPYSTYTFTASATDTHGYSMDMPENITWTLSDDSFGTISDGTFVSNGKLGEVDVQIVYNGEIYGSKTIKIMHPFIAFEKSENLVPYGKSADIDFSVLMSDYDGEEIKVYYAPDVFEITLSDNAAGQINGYVFTATEDTSIESVDITVTYRYAPEISITQTQRFGRSSEIIEDFENGIDDWMIMEKTDATSDGTFNSVFTMSEATAADGQVHDGNGSLRMYTDSLGTGIHSNYNANYYLFPKNDIIITDAKTIGAWVYIPDEMVNFRIQLIVYAYDESKDSYSAVNGGYGRYTPVSFDQTIDEPGWHFISVDVSNYSKVMIRGGEEAGLAYQGTEVAQNCRFLQFNLFSGAKVSWQPTYGTLNGKYTVYVDSIVVDYSDATDDREEPIFSDMKLVSGQTETVIPKVSNSDLTAEPLETSDDIINITATVTENTEKANATGLDLAKMKAYVDGVEVSFDYYNNTMAISNIKVAPGVHRIKFEAYDKAGNKAVIIRMINVTADSDVSTVQLVPDDPTLEKLYGGSVYWMDLNASRIETIDKVEMVVDINSNNHWELDHMITAEGFTAGYTLDEETNTATITVERTGENTQTGEATLVKLPIRVTYYDTDINVEGKTAQTYWSKSCGCWGEDLKVDVDKGSITYVDGYHTDVLPTFSNDNFSVTLEMFANSTSTYITQEYLDERGTYHVHTPVAADIPATCTEPGYTGRTFCNICNSVVDWGTEVPATGHTYSFVEGVLRCECGETFTGTWTDGKEYVDGVVRADGWYGDYYYLDGEKLTDTTAEVDGIYYDFDENGLAEKHNGLLEIDGKNYFAVAGALVSGWQYNEDLEKWCYFDDETLTTVDELEFSDVYGNKVTYQFNDDGTVVGGGVWKQIRDLGMRFYYGPDYYKKRSETSDVDFFEINGNIYGFDGMGFRYEGINKLKRNIGLLPTLEVFTDDGIYVGKYSGVYEGYYYEDGLIVSGLGIIRLDDAYYYITLQGTTYSGTRFVTEEQAHGLIPAGSYKFGEDGKLLGIIPAADSTVIDYENGLIYGLALNLSSLDGYAQAANEYFTLEYSADKLATGTTVTVMFNGEAFASYKVVIFGDVNGDGWYDGMDSIIVNCLVNGMLTREQVGEAAYLAADCNHDDVIDEADVALLEQAGLILANVDQSKSPEVLVTDSAYVEYLSLIDQTVEAEESDADAPTDTTAPESGSEAAESSPFTAVISIIKALIRIVKSFVDYLSGISFIK